MLRIDHNHSCWFTVPGIATFFVNADTTQIRINAAQQDVSAPAVRLFLLSTVLALLCHKRGYVPLHASCVDIDGGAVLFTGPSCAGKSLIAAAFLKLGCAILSDDITVVNAASPADATVLPSFPRLRLWRGALEALGFAPETLPRSRPELEKYDVCTRHAFVSDPRPLTAIYHLRRRRKRTTETIARLHGARALRDATQSIYCAQAGRVFGRDAGSIDRIAAICSGASSNVLYCEPGFDGVAAIAMEILKQHRRPL